MSKKRDSDGIEVKLFLKESYEFILKDNEKMKSRQLNKRGNILLLYRMTFLWKHNFHSLFSLFFSVVTSDTFYKHISILNFYLFIFVEKYYCAMDFNQKWLW